MNLYAYAYNDPLNGTDPSGLWVESGWDAFNVGLGVYSLQDNVRRGEWGWAAVDTVGLIYDGAATVVPFLPAGASAGLKAIRAGNTVRSAVNVGSDVAATARATDRAARGASTSGGAARRGREIHNQVADAVEGDLSSGAISHLRGANGATGPQPDLQWGDAPGVWADVTTPGAWGNHVSRYDTFGEGVGILYQPGVGVTNSTRLRSGAGIIAAGGQIATGSSNSCASNPAPPCR